MSATIDMQHIRYLNLFESVARVSTRFCFKYNNMIFFCVPKPLLRRAIGENGANVRRVSQILGKKIKIIPIPAQPNHIRPFIESIVNPVPFKDIEIRGNEIILSASTQSKAALIGRDKVRLFEMQKIISDFFNKEFKIV
jgi:transcription antitermination factor NusA-like protein